MLVEHPVTIHKNQIAEAATYKWRTNAVELDIDGYDHLPGTLTLVGFIGTHVGDQQYAGVYRFETGRYEDAETFDFEDLPGIGITSEEQDDGVHTHAST